MGPEGNQHFFPGAINTTIHGGIFPAVHGDMRIHSSYSRRHGLELLIANIAQGAFHNAAERGDPTRCHPHTRFAIRAEIMEWIRAPTAHRKFILWLYGPAGAGKTAIAQTIAEECEKAGLLAASFFFGRTAVGRNNLSRFITTLAYQLSRSIPEICEPILAAIENEPTIFSRTISTQKRVLVIEPLASFTGPIRKGPQVVVVDGVDEAGPNGEAQAELLYVLGTAVTELRHIPIIFLVGSRPESDIRLTFNMNPLRSLIKGLVLDDKYRPDADIKRYFESNFRKIRDKQLALGTPLPSQWPMERDVNRLIKKSSGQFIFASTVTKFIDSPRRDPVNCLDIILGLSNPGKETPFAQLDALYRHILSSVDNLPKVLEVLTFLMLADGYSDRLRVRVVDEFLGLEVRRVLVDMHALISIPPPTDPGAILRIHHASLYDFLMDRSRSQNFFVDVKQGLIMIGQRWLEMIGDYADSKRSEECSLSFQIEAFIRHGRKLPGGELADCLASFDLRALLDKIRNGEDLYGPNWDGFMTACKEQQAKAQVDFFPRLQNEFHAFILNGFSQYPPSIQACIPALLRIGSDGFHGRFSVSNLFLILLHGACRSKAEFAQMQDLDGRLLNIRNFSRNNYFHKFFQSRMGSQRNNVTLIKELVRVIHPKPGDAKNYVIVKDVESLQPYEFPLDKLLSVPPFDLSDLLATISMRSDLAYFLREHALRYRYSGKLDECRRYIAFSSLTYVHTCGIFYLEHTHPLDTDRCIICEECPDVSVCQDTEKFLPTSELIRNDSVPDPSLDLESLHSSVGISLMNDEINRASPAFTAWSEAPHGPEFTIVPYRPDLESPAIRSSFSDHYNGLFVIDELPEPDYTSDSVSHFYPSEQIPAVFLNNSMYEYVNNIVKIQYRLADREILPLMIQDSITMHHDSLEAVHLLARAYYKSQSNQNLSVLQDINVISTISSLKRSLAVKSRFTADDAMTALHIISLYVFHGERGRWNEFLFLASRYVKEVLENPEFYDTYPTALEAANVKDQFVVKTTIWFDVLASVTTKQPPILLKYIRGLFRPNCLQVGQPTTYSMLSPMGCENTVVWALAETLNLSYWKRRGEAMGALSVGELMQRVQDIEVHLQQGSRPVRPHPDPDTQSRFVASEIFRTSTKLFLKCVESGDFPHVAEVKQCVNETCDAILESRKGLGTLQSAVVRSTVFCIFICGSLTDDLNLRRLLSTFLVEQEGMGNCTMMSHLLQEMWEERRAGPLDVPVKWQEYLANAQILLV